MLLGVTWVKVIFELLAYVCLGLCAWHAWGMGALRRARLIELSVGVGYGVSLETLTILQLHAYQYGHFLVMLGPVPLCIGVDWGVILYSAMSFADTLTWPRWATPALVGLLGLNIDLSMDAVAIRQDMWHWNLLSLDSQWFGVPWANFYAWFIVLCSASALFWLARPLTARACWRGPLAALGAYLGSLLILAGLDELVVRYDRTPGAIFWLFPALLIGAGLVVAVVGAWVAWRGGRGQESAEPPSRHSLIPAIAPFYFHAIFIAALIVSGIATQLPALLAVALTMLAISLALHGWLLRRALAPRAVAEARAAGAV
jgi:hypothetical protein